jgi:hypothetical protein
MNYKSMKTQSNANRSKNTYNKYMAILCLQPHFPNEAWSLRKAPDQLPEKSGYVEPILNATVRGRARKTKRGVKWGCVEG